MPSHPLIPRMDWDRAPYNRWSFQHIREILPTSEVWRGNGPIRALPRREQKLDDLLVAGLHGKNVPLAQLLDDTYTDGLLVLKDGAVVAECYLNGMTPHTLHLSQSVAKSFVGILAGIFADRGQLDVAAPVTNYLPELQATAWKGATLQQVLDMTTGVAFGENYTDAYSDIGQVDVASGWKPIPPDSDPAFKWPGDMWSLILGLKTLARAHGESFEYRSIETDVLGFVLERVSGKRLPQILSEELWQKIGASESACYTVDPTGFAIADGGLNACLMDYGRFGQLLLECGGGIIPAKWIEETRRGLHNIFSATYAETLPQGAYHNQFWIEDPASRSLMCRGVFGQMIHVNFENQMVVVKLSSWPDFLNAKFEMATQKAIHAIAQRLSD